MSDSSYYTKLANLLFPELEVATMLSTEDYEAQYPPRDLPEGAAVTRLGPSPTGFIHLGNLFMAIVNQRLAEQSGGVFLLRIEDTDKKREVEGAVTDLISSLGYFGISFGEGVTLRGEKGKYRPYFQSNRRKIYRSFARKLVMEGKAYPCFLNEHQLDAIRATQEASKELPGIYGSYAEWRGADLDVIENMIRRDGSYVIRLFADYDGVADENENITVTDGIRGELTMSKNIMDVVILKHDGMPTYHFAHVVDDWLMRTTHVVRGEEWLPSLSIHIALFKALGLTPPTYCHTALLMKTEDGVKRKLSKRKDPESALTYYMSHGYHPLAIKEYLLTVINSNYEEWRLENPDADCDEFLITTEKMGAHGMLFDLDKVQHISRETLARIPARELADFMIDWAGSENPDALPVFLENFDILTAALDIGRSGEKPRKDLVYAEQIFKFLLYFFDQYFRIEDPLPENISEREANILLKGYLAGYDYADGRERWFEKIRELAVSNGYAAKPKDYKNEPEKYKGHVGDVSTVIRRALTGRCNAPDIYEIEHILGEDRVRGRIESAITA